MKIIDTPNVQEWDQLATRPIVDVATMNDIVKKIFAEVKNNGDAAVKKYTYRFDHVEVKQLQVSEEEIFRSENEVDEQLKKAILTASENIRKFHNSQQVILNKIETMPGVSCWQQPAPIEKIGLYIPGGTAPLFSTILMLAIPAQIAGCSEIVLCTPPSVDGTIHHAILYAAKMSGITEIFKAGGVQAIAAMTLGTESIPAVYKIFGPGNQYVTAAKMEALRYGIAIDLPAGPSELMIVADETADPAFIAADLLSQAEHGKDSQVILITWVKELIPQVVKAIEGQLEALDRKIIALAALENSSLICVGNKKEALHAINRYAPEHLILAIKDEDYFCHRIRNAGSVFIGNYTPESAGDYASGTNHTLPTAGFSRVYGGVSLDAFIKKITFQKISCEGLQKLAPTIIRMADEEKFDAHKKAVTLRLKNI